MIQLLASSESIFQYYLQQTSPYMWRLHRPGLEMACCHFGDIETKPIRMMLQTWTAPLIEYHFPSNIKKTVTKKEKEMVVVGGRGYGKYQW
jgi:hypothetical protein